MSVVQILDEDETYLNARIEFAGQIFEQQLVKGPHGSDQFARLQAYGDQFEKDWLEMMAAQFDAPA